MPILDKSHRTYHNNTRVLSDHSKQSLLYAVFMSIFCSVLMTDYLINILLSPGARGRDQIIPYTLLFFIPIFCFYSIAVILKMNKLINNAFLMKVAILWFCFIFFRIIQGFISGADIDFYGLFAQIIFFYVGCTFAESINRTKWPFFLILTFFISILIIIYFIYSMYSTNAYKLVGLMYFSDLRPQYEYDLIQSTELSNYCGQIFIIGSLLVMNRELWGHYKKWLILISIILPIIIFVIFFLFSVATFIGLLLVILFVVIRKQRSYFQVLALIIFITVLSTIIYFSEWSQFIKDLYNYKAPASDRKILYSALIELIAEHPFWGAGRGKFFDMYGYYPHQNILGTWAEGGLFLLLFYSWLIILVISLYTRLRNNLLYSSDRLIFEVAISILLFWHFKGLVQDTWNNINLYFWTGIITGGYIKYKTSIKTGFRDRFLSASPS